MDQCNDNRNEIIKETKEYIIRSTNIDTDKDEMKVLDNICFRLWQLGLTKRNLDKLRVYEEAGAKNSNVYKELIKKYGDKQLIVAVEELSELQKELCKALRGKPNKENIIEEFADVLIMLDQVKIYFKIEDDEIRDIIDQKIERTKERLLNG